MSTQIWRELGVDASEGAPSPNPKPLFMMSSFRFSLNLPDFLHRFLLTIVSYTHITSGEGLLCTARREISFHWRI